MTSVRLFLLILMSFVISGCMASTPFPSEWKAEKEGILLNVKADHDLNETEGKSRTLYIVAYQLSSSSSFNQLRQSKEGLTSLLEGLIYDSSVTSVKSIVIYPDSDTTHRIDRSEGTMYLGVVAGYNNLTTEGSSRIHDIPVILKGKKFLRNPGHLVPCRFEVDLKLGARHIEILPPENTEKKSKER